MKKRQDSKAVDIEKLYEVLATHCISVVDTMHAILCFSLHTAIATQEKARSPTGLLTVQIGKMECGQFVGKIKPDKDVERMARSLSDMLSL